MAVQGEGNSLTLSPGGKNLVKSLADILANSLRIKTGNRRGQNQLFLLTMLRSTPLKPEQP